MKFSVNIFILAEYSNIQHRVAAVGWTELREITHNASGIRVRDNRIQFAIRRIIIKLSIVHWWMWWKQQGEGSNTSDKRCIKGNRVGD